MDRRFPIRHLILFRKVLVSENVSAKFELRFTGLIGGLGVVVVTGVPVKSLVSRQKVHGVEAH